MDLEKDTFCDTVFDTGKSIITIKGKVKQRDKTFYLIECSVCSLDKELFPDELLLRSKASILKGSYGCRCCTPRWTEYQYRIIVDRICTEANYTFLGWNGEYNGNKTKLLLRNNTSGFEWGSTDINKLFLGRRSPEEKSIKSRERATKSDTELIDKMFDTGMFLKGTVFCRSDKRNQWLYRCPKCSVDDYVKAGVCNGVFTAKYAVNGKSSLSCRCSNSKKMSTDEKIVRIKSLMVEDEEFLSLNNESHRQTFNWLCGNGHEVKTSIEDFIYGDNRCKECAKTGFSETKEAWLYIVKLEYEGDYYIKYGVTNRAKVVERVKELVKGKITTFEVEHTFYFDKGFDALQLENEIKSKFKDLSGIHKDALVSGYTETLPYNRDVKDKLLSVIDEKAH